jgi:hypothetical protein
MQNLAAKQDEIFGEWFDVVPMSRPPNQSASRDLTRPAVIVVGIFTNPAADADLGIGMKIPTSTPNVSFARNALEWVPRPGDIIRRRCDGLQYEVDKVRPDGVSRIVFDLHQMGLPVR